MTFGARPPSMTPMLSVDGPMSSSGAIYLADAIERVEQFFDRRLAQLRKAECAMRPSANNSTRTAPLVALASLLSVGSPSSGSGRRRDAGWRISRPRCCALRRRRKQPGGKAVVAEFFGGANLRRDDSLGVARAAAVDAGFVLGRSEERRHRVHVRREEDCGTRLFGEPAYTLKRFH